MSTELGSQYNIKHLAIIMDGNARWAAQHGLPKSAGHRAGANKVGELLPEFITLNIPYVTLYTFSSENWQRSKTEVAVLLQLLSFYLTKEIDSLHKNGVKIKVIGRLDLLNVALQKQINDAVKLTSNNKKITLCMAFSYGGRNEIIDACNKVISAEVTRLCEGFRVDEESFKQYLYDPDMPDVDLLIRTGGTFRISNFLLWQAAYAELYFSTTYWPDFNKNDLMKALHEYLQRKRNFGKR